MYIKYFWGQECCWCLLKHHVSIFGEKRRGRKMPEGEIQIISITRNNILQIRNVDEKGGWSGKTSAKRIPSLNVH